MAKKTYRRQAELTEIYEKLGMVKGAWSCACYVPKIGNTPKKGDMLAWSESSAINYANSAIGARTNRDSMGIDTLSALLGKTPHFGLLTDEGRRATWLIECDLPKLPHPEMLGSAIGLKVQEEVPYIVGMDKLFNQLGDEYMKDLGAATASNGAVGLYHLEGVTPEAIEQGKDLLKADNQTYKIDWDELVRVFESYPMLWKDENAKPQRVFIVTGKIPSVIKSKDPSFKIPMEPAFKKPV